MKKLYEKFYPSRFCFRLNLIIIMSVSIFILFPQHSVLAESFVPNWVKDTAKWWNQGLVPDEDFLSGLEFMIEEEIITVSTTSKSSDDTTKLVPAWVKDKAGLWADGLVPASDFLSGLEFMIGEGIISLPNLNDSNDEDDFDLSIFHDPQFSGYRMTSLEDHLWLAIHKIPYDEIFRGGIFFGEFIAISELILNKNNENFDPATDMKFNPIAKGAVKVFHPAIGSGYKVSSTGNSWYITLKEPLLANGKIGRYLFTCTAEGPGSFGVELRYNYLGTSKTAQVTEDIQCIKIFEVINNQFIITHGNLLLKVSPASISIPIGETFELKAQASLQDPFLPSLPVTIPIGYWDFDGWDAAKIINAKRDGQGYLPAIQLDYEDLNLFEGDSDWSRAVNSENPDDYLVEIQGGKSDNTWTVECEKAGTDYPEISLVNTDEKFVRDPSLSFLNQRIVIPEDIILEVICGNGVYWTSEWSPHPVQEVPEHNSGNLEVTVRVIYSETLDPVEGAEVHARFATFISDEIVSGITDANGIAVIKHTIAQCPERGGYFTEIMDITGEDIFFDESNLDFFETKWGGPVCETAETP